MDFGRWLDEHMPVVEPPRNSPDAAIYIVVALGIIVAVAIGRFLVKRLAERFHFHWLPGYATAALGLVAVVYAGLALTISRVPGPLTFGVIFLAFVLPRRLLWHSFCEVVPSAAIAACCVIGVRRSWW
jgi:hypothetical protein